jgi:two-component system, cell cycle sensor histidine kinase and response regulator CckA
MKMTINRRALQVSLIYGLGAGLWIVGSDWLLRQCVSNPDGLTRLASFKGCFFVLVTGILFYVALSRMFRRVEEEAAKRRISSEALWASEMHFRSLFDNMQEGCAFCRMLYEQGRPVDFVYLEVNGNFERLTGLRDVVGKKVSEAIPGLQAAHPELFEIYGRVVATGQPEHFELYLEPLKAWLSVSAYVAEKDCFAAVFENITERKQAEEALRRSESLNRNLVAHLPQQIFIKDREGVYISCNDNFARELGLSRDQILGRDDFAICPRAQAEKYRRDDQQVIASGQPLRMEERYAVAGEERWAHTIKVPYHDEHGRVVGVMGIFEDITGRKRAEAQSQVQLAALSASANAIVITDREGAVRWVNEAFTRLTGYEFEEVAGQNPRVLKSGKQDEAFYQRMWDTLLRGQVWHGEVVNKRKDGALYTEEMTITPVRSTGEEITHFIAVKQDVTARLLLEEKLRQSQKMEAFGQLAGGVAHDFNNALSIIQIQSDLLRGMGGLSGDQDQLLAEINQAVQHASNLTRQLLLFGRKKKAEMQRLDLNETVAGFIKMLQRILGEDIRAQFHCSPAVLAVNADAGMMEQVLINLATNARDAMPAGGRLTLATRVVELDEAAAAQMPQGRPGSFVCLSVSDTGKGIAPEILPRIFEPFFTTKDVGKGTGLGLATVFGIVQQHQGWVQVESAVGRGTEFLIYLPRLAGETDADAAPAARRVPPAGRETILLVEDDPALSLSVCRALTRLGYRVLEATNGPEAIKEWRQQAGRVDLLLTDLRLPEGPNGRELADQLQKEKPGLKVIFISGYSPDAVDGGQPVREGFDFLPKPLELMKLAETVRARLDG